MRYGWLVAGVGETAGGSRELVGMPEGARLEAVDQDDKNSELPWPEHCFGMSWGWSPTTVHGQLTKWLQNLVRGVGHCVWILPGELFGERDQWCEWYDLKTYQVRRCLH